MIRFVDLRGQSTGYRFAFWCTVHDRFVTFAGEQAWDTEDDFIASYQCSAKKFPLSQPLSRFLNLMPSWASKDPENESQHEGLSPDTLSSFTDVMQLIDRGWDSWASKSHNHKWSRRVEGTPIRNDLTCAIAHAIADFQNNVIPSKKKEVDDA